MKGPQLDTLTCKEVTLSRSITPKDNVVSWRKCLEVGLVAVCPPKGVLVPGRNSDGRWRSDIHDLKPCMVSVFICIASVRLRWRWRGSTSHCLFVFLFSRLRDIYILLDRASMGTSPEEIEQHLATALEANGSLNGIADLLALASPATKPPQLQYKAIYALYRTYTLVFTTKRLDALRADPSPPAQAVRQWLLQKLEQFLSLLTQQLYTPEPSINVSSITLSPESSHPFLSPLLCKCHFPYCASALPHSPTVMEIPKSIQYTLKPLFAVYSARLPALQSATRPEMNSSTNSSSPMMIYGGSSFARSSMP